MNSDHAFVTGREHYVCEDYAASGRDRAGQPYVVVADGCSGSPDTDIGARLLVKSAELYLRDATDALEADDYHRNTIWRALAAAEGLDLSPMCCDATLLTAKVVGDEFRVYVCGDGVVALKLRGEPFVLHAINYAVDHNAPPGTQNLQGYASYMARPDRYRQFLDHPHHLEVETFYYVGGDGPQYESKISEQDRGEKFVTAFGGETKHFEWVALMSDGAQSFTRLAAAGAGAAREIVPVIDAASGLLAFKGFNGKFVQRRVNRFEKDAAKLGWAHEDDLSLGVIHFD